MTYATDRLYAEIAYVAYYLHWAPRRHPRSGARRAAAVRRRDRRLEHADLAGLGVEMSWWSSVREVAESAARRPTCGPAAADGPPSGPTRARAGLAALARRPAGAGRAHHADRAARRVRRLARRASGSELPRAPRRMPCRHARPADWWTGWPTSRREPRTATARPASWPYTARCVKPRSSASRRAGPPSSTRWRWSPTPGPRSRRGSRLRRYRRPARRSAPERFTS